MLTSYDGTAITYDTIGNPLNDGTWTYGWEHGRQLATMSNGATTWNYSYDANGMRTSRTDGTTTYTYVYNNGLLMRMTVGTHVLDFTYDASGTPMTVTLDGVTYYYLTNIQGDVISVIDENGALAAYYAYDAWGNPIAESSSSSVIGSLNPLRYRSYVYDSETGLYYLQSRYYSSKIGRFINADGYVSTGQGFIGNNVFVYCLNNPINLTDASGYLSQWFADAGEWLNDYIIDPIVYAFSPDTYTVSGSIEEGLLRGVGSATAGYSELNGRLQVNMKDNYGNGMLGGYGKFSGGNVAGEIGVGNDDISLSLKGVGDGVTASAQAGVQYKDGVGVAAKAKAAVLSGRATTEFSLFGFEFEFGVSGDILSIGAEAMYGYFPQDGFTAKTNVGAGLFGFGFIFRIKPPQ